jgi:2'-5' RNA ligase
MIKLFDILKEQTQPKYEYGCAMLYFDFPTINQIHEIINQEDVFEDPTNPTFGLEKEPHTTLLYGLHDGVTEQDVKNVLDKFTFGACKISNASLFENEKFDVLKFDVDGKGLYEVNAELVKYPNTQTYPDYHPHLTIAYLKPGTGKQYADMLKGKEFELTPTYAVYSMPNGDKPKISINND